MKCTRTPVPAHSLFSISATAPMPFWLPPESPIMTMSLKPLTLKLRAVYSSSFW